jgi:hypothetical protein
MYWLYKPTFPVSVCGDAGAGACCAETSPGVRAVACAPAITVLFIMVVPFVVPHMCNIAMPESAHPVPENNAHEIMPLVFERATTAPSRGMPANERTILVHTVAKLRA